VTVDAEYGDVTMALRPEKLADWRAFCKCTEDQQHDPRCDGSLCVGQERAIAREINPLLDALREIIDIDHHNHGPKSRATEIARTALSGR
jgi:hypothetical protein